MTRVRRVRWSHRLVYAAARTALFLLSILPERCGYAITAWIARMFLACSPKRRAVGLANLALAYPEDGSTLDRRARLRMLRGGVASAFQNVIDFEYAKRWLRKGRLHERVDMAEADRHRPSGPFYGLTLHLGSWEVAAAAIAGPGQAVHAIGRLPRNPLFAEYLRQQREAFGVVVHGRRGGMRAISRALRSGDVVVHAVDQNQRLRGVFAPFFGKLAATERGPATMAVRRGYPIVVAVCARSGPGFRFRFRVAPPIEVAHTGDLQADVTTTVTRINQACEFLVREHPDQYLWIHDRYRTRPPGEDVATLAP
ncbi:MAG: lysophospholipid acyltransferase family protein [Planctomycetota bacterium]